MTKNKFVRIFVQTITKHLMYILICTKILDTTGYSLMIIVLFVCMIIELGVMND